MLGIGEIIIIILVIGVVIFGAKKLPEIAKSLGRFGGEVQKGKMEMEKEIKKAKSEVSGKEEDSSEEKKENTNQHESR